MQTAAALLVSLGDHVDTIKAHLATLHIPKLQALLATLPSRSPAGSAEMVMRILVLRELEARHPGPRAVP
jgi:hypothetical protein